MVFLLDRVPHVTIPQLIHLFFRCFLILLSAIIQVIGGCSLVIQNDNLTDKVSITPSPTPHSDQCYLLAVFPARLFSIHLYLHLKEILCCFSFLYKWGKCCIVYYRPLLTCFFHLTIGRLMICVVFLNMNVL